MLINKKGDLLKASENIICHQVNEDGVMGVGLAKQIANLYPKVEKNYKRFCLDFNNMNLFGHYQLCSTEKERYIANCFTQRNFITNLNDIRKVFSSLLELCKKRDFSIAVPYGYGCGIAKGNWNEVRNLFEELSNEYEIDISIYKLEGDNKNGK